MKLKNKYIYIIGIILWTIAITNFIVHIKLSERNKEILYELQEIKEQLKKHSERVEKLRKNFEN